MNFAGATTVVWGWSIHGRSFPPRCLPIPPSALEVPVCLAFGSGPSTSFFCFFVSPLIFNDRLHVCVCVHALARALIELLKTARWNILGRKERQTQDGPKMAINLSHRWQNDNWFSTLARHTHKGEKESRPLSPSLSGINITRLKAGSKSLVIGVLIVKHVWTNPLGWFWNLTVAN